MEFEICYMSCIAVQVYVLLFFICFYLFFFPSVRCGEGAYWGFDLDTFVCSSSYVSSSSYDIHVTYLFHLYPPHVSSSYDMHVSSSSYDIHVTYLFPQCTAEKEGTGVTIWTRGPCPSPKSCHSIGMYPPPHMTYMHPPPHITWAVLIAKEFVTR